METGWLFWVTRAENITSKIPRLWGVWERAECVNNRSSVNSCFLSNGRYRRSLSCFPSFFFCSASAGAVAGWYRVGKAGKNEKSEVNNVGKKRTCSFPTPPHLRNRSSASKPVDFFFSFVPGDDGSHPSSTGPVDTVLPIHLATHFSTPDARR